MVKRISEIELHDMQAQAEYRGDGERFEAVPTSGFGASVGSVMAAALAAAGATVCDFAGRKICETDYLAISGARFPEVPADELVAFNEATLKPNMTEADEFDRYRKIATFFHGR